MLDGFLVIGNASLEKHFSQTFDWISKQNTKNTEKILNHWHVIAKTAEGRRHNT